MKMGTGHFKVTGNDVVLRRTYLGKVAWVIAFQIVLIIVGTVVEEKVIVLATAGISIILTLFVANYKIKTEIR